jgi:hypothetical protein
MYPEILLFKYVYIISEAKLKKHFYQPLQGSWYMDKSCIVIWFVLHFLLVFSFLELQMQIVFHMVGKILRESAVDLSYRHC